MSEQVAPSASGEVEGEDLPGCWTGPARGFGGLVEFGEGTRPWNWAELDGDAARSVWSLVGQFVDFFNARYAERPEHRIPPCWAQHGALAEEITTLWWARWQAFDSEHASIGGAQYWHSYTLHGFLDRMVSWLGADRLERCQQGLHEERDIASPTSESQWRASTAQFSDEDVAARAQVSDPTTDRFGQPTKTRQVVVRFLEER